MANSPNRLSQIWRELKRRNVVRVMTVYAGAAFVILELVSMSEEPFGLPEWTFVLAVVLLSIGFFISVILSWIYDIHPEGGMIKTEPLNQVKGKNVSKSSNGWKIASYVSFLVILGLIALNIFGGKSRRVINELPKKTIAVLPFLNLSGDSEQKWRCIGLTDEIIRHLFKVKSFDEVRSMETVKNYIETDRNIPAIAEELEVNYILGGSLKRIGNELMVTTQLIDAINDTPIWLNDYPLESTNIMGIPAEIALQIANHLRAFITEDEQERLGKIPTSNDHAYSLLQKAKTSFYSHGWPATADEIELVLEATMVDPAYAEAFAWIGYMFFTRGSVFGDRSMQTVSWDALNYFQIALSLDPDNATAHNGMGWLNECQKYNYITAEKEYLVALELEPNNPVFVWAYQDFLVRRTLFDQAITIQNQLDSIRGAINWNRRMWIQALSGNVGESMEVYEAHIRQNDSIYWESVGSSLLYNGEYLKAINVLMHWSFPRAKAHLAVAYHRAGSSDKAEMIVNELKEKSQYNLIGSPDFFIGSYYSGIKQIDSAFVWLEKAYENRSPELIWLKALPLFEDLKQDERYWDLYTRIGHKAYDEYLARMNK